MSRPLVFYTLSFCCGIFLSRECGLPVEFWLFCASALLMAGFFIQRPAFFILSSCCLIAVCGALRYAQDDALPADHVSVFHSARAEFPCRIRGFVNNDPYSEGEAKVIVLELREIEMNALRSSCCGKVLVRAVSDRDFTYGEELIVEGRLYGHPSMARGSSGRYRDYLCAEKIYSMMHVPSETCLVRTGTVRANPVTRLALFLRKKTLEAITGRLGRIPAAVVSAMVLGEKRFLPAPVLYSMISVGTVHILVVSGFNVAVVTALLMMVLKLLRLPRRPRIFAALPVLLLYCLMTGAADPVIRATIMGSVFLCAYCLQREPDALNAVALSALAILLWQPQHIFEIGFQLSFASVVSLILFVPRLDRLVSIDQRILRWLYSALSASLSAWLGTAGIIAVHFKLVSPVAVLANIFIPALAGAITVCGLVLAGFSYISPWCAKSFAAVTELLVLLLLQLNSFFSRLPWASIRLP
jgi:competence protein ComEC